MYLIDAHRYETGASSRPRRYLELQIERLLTNAYRMSCGPQIEWSPYRTSHWEPFMKRLALLAAAALVLGSTLGGCIIVPDGGWHHHYGYYD